MRIFFATVLCLFIVLTASLPAASQSVGVPLSSTVYDFIDRFEAKGILPRTLSGSKPLSREETARIIAEIRKRVQSGYAVSNVDAEKLVYYEQEFREELLKLDRHYAIEEIRFPDKINRLFALAPGDFFYKNGRNFFSYSDDSYSLYVDPMLDQDNRISSNDTLAVNDEVFRYASGFKVRGNLKERIGFYIDIRNTKEWGSREYPMISRVTSPGLGWVNNKGDHQYHDETIAYVVVGLSPVELEFGKNLNRWGPGYRGTLMLSDNATSYDLVKLKFQSRRLKYMHLLGFLTPYPRIVESETGAGATYKVQYASKYIAAHRIEFNLMHGIDIGLNEAVIYGQRSIEPAYLNPVMFLRSAEHFLGDQDNALMGADIAMTVVDGWKWYGELLIDDIFTTRLGTKWYGNKLAFLGGALWTDPFGIENTSLRVEYSRIKPFVYTHKYQVNVYKHFDTGLGHPNGPNTDEWFIRGRHDFSRRLSTALEFSFLRHGANPPGINVGGEQNKAHRPEDPANIGFLEGDIEKTVSAKFDVSYEVFRNLFVQAHYTYINGDDYRIQGVSGQDFGGRRFFFAVRMNY